MSRKIECDGCAKQANETSTLNGMPHGWFTLTENCDYASFDKRPGSWHYCSLDCVAGSVTILLSTPP